MEHRTPQQIRKELRSLTRQTLGYWTALLALFVIWITVTGCDDPRSPAPPIASGPTCAEFRDCASECVPREDLGRYGDELQTACLDECRQYELPKGTGLSDSLVSAWADACAKRGRHEPDPFCQVVTETCEEKTQ